MSRQRVQIASGNVVSRADRRALAREQAKAKVQVLRDWHQARIEAAEKRRQARHDDVKAKQAVEDLTRGVHRVPARLQGLTVTEGRHLYGKRDTKQQRPLAQPEDLHPMGNYETRRARGHRGHGRKPRRRELPGAMARRIERNRKQWSAS